MIFDDNVRVVENSATNAGGGIFVEDATLQPNDAEIANNTPNDCTGTTEC
jgi:predicted outer membrane repeat protein